MNRTISSVRLDDRTTRYRVRIESDDCETDPLKRQIQLMLFDNFAQNPSLTECGPVACQKFVMHHNGQHWIVELEATVEQAT